MTLQDAQPYRAQSPLLGLPRKYPSGGAVLLWLSAGAAALALHAGVAVWALWKPPAPPGEATAAAVMIEMAPAPAAPMDEPPEIAPDMVERQEIPETTDVPDLTPERPILDEPPPETLPEVAEDLPPLPDMTPVPVPEPEVALARPVARPERPPPVEKPKPVEKQKEKPQQETRRARAEASETAPKPAAAANSTAQRGSMSPAKWQSRLMAHLERRKRYPAAARSQRVEGTVYVSFSLDASGTVLRAAITRSSGNADLDAEVLSLVKRSSPLPAPPPDAPRDITAPVRFNLE